MPKSWLMLAPSKSISEEHLYKLHYPLLASPKIDGIRASVNSFGCMLTRSGSDIPNTYTRGLFSNNPLCGLDGELTVGPPTALGDEQTVMSRTVSGVMSLDGEPDVTFHVFDRWDLPSASQFNERLASVSSMVPHTRVVAVQHHLCNNAEDVLVFEAIWLAAGYEGVMLRDPSGLYVPKRTTIKEANVLKFKRFEDCEAVVVGWKEEMHNSNDIGPTGRRSTHRSGLTPKGTLGAIVVRAINGRFSGTEFDVGSGPGFAMGQRDRLWAIRDSGLVGLTANVRYFPTGIKDKPRFATFQGFRAAGI